jgi:ankyrin repeat protein
MDERLRVAIEAGDTGAVGQLLEKEPALASARYDVLSAVMLAAYHRQPEIARALLGARGPADFFEAAALGLTERMKDFVGWDPGTEVSRSPDGFTALHLAAYFGHPETVRLLLDQGVDVEPVADNASRVRPLHSAVAGGSVEAVELLLEAGAHVEARQSGGFTPLMGAAAGGSEELVRRLLDAGADRAAESDDGKTAADLARENGHERVAAQLAH